MVTQIAQSVLKRKMAVGRHANKKIRTNDEVKLGKFFSKPGLQQD
jgi:hypothetical protein